MKVLIIEDEKLAVDHLTKLIGKYDPKIQIAGRCDSIRKSVEWFSSNNHPDLAFFDIQLADGLSFEIFEKISVECPIIFTTAFNEYAIKAFKVNSVDYLLKPIDFEELTAAIDKFKKNYSTEPKQDLKLAFDNVMDMLTNNYKQRFVVKVGEHIRSIAVSDILYFYSLEKAAYMHTVDDHNYVVDNSLDQIEQMLDPKIFFKINRKYLISLTSFDDIISYSNSRLKIELKHSTDMDAIVAREKVQKFKQWLDR